MVADILGCEVLLDGKRFADGREGDDMLAPLALDGLRVTWGRETTVDQPEPSTCTLEVMDARGGAAFLGMIYAGASLEVRSRTVVGGGVGGSTTIQTLPDPGFDETAPGDTPPNALPELASSAKVVLDDDGGHLLALDKATGATPNPSLARVTLAPGPITTGDPDAWATLPRVDSSGEWSYTLDVLAPPGAAVNVQAVYFYAPDGVGNTGAGSATVLNVTGTGSLEPLAHDPFALSPTEPAWLGLWVQVSYTRWDGWPTSNGATWDEVGAGLTWDDLTTTRIDNVNLYLTTEDEGPSNDLVVFAGSVTDVKVEWDESLPPLGGARLSVTATDFSAETNNFYVGDEPWPVEPMATRFARVITELNQQTSVPYGYSSVIDPELGAIALGFQDVDNTSALSLLSSFAESVDGVLWPAVHVTYPQRYFYVEDINKRTSGVVLRVEDGYVVVDDSGNVGRTRLSACYVLRDPVSFEQSTEDATTRVAVGWQEQTTDDEGEPAPTDRTVELVDADLETRLGVRRVQTSTLLQAEDDAENHAERKLRRLTPQTWRALGIVYDLAIHAEGYTREVQERARALLDGTTRIGLPLVLTDLPEWSPAGTSLPVYIEGGVYEFTGGRWSLSLVVSNVYGAGSSAAWDDMPTEWRWDDFAPDLDAVLYAWDGAAGTSSSTARTGAGDVVRRNNAANPRALVNDGRWRYQVGTDEAGTTTYVTGVADGPVLPDGTRATSYVRRTITTSKSAGNSGHYYRALAGDIAGTAGQSLGLAFYVRTSEEVPITTSVQVRSGASVVTTASGTARTLPSGEWVRVEGLVVASGAYDGYQVWCSLPPGSVLSAGASIDAVAVLAEPGVAAEPGDYFDGDTLADPGTGGGVTWDDLYGAEVAPGY